MVYKHCINDFSIILHQKIGNYNYSFYKLFELKTKLTTPSIILLYQNVSKPYGIWKEEIVECIFVENPSTYFETLENKAVYIFGCIKIDLELNDSNFSHDILAEARKKGIEDEFRIRAELKIEPINLRTTKDRN